MNAPISHTATIRQADLARIESYVADRCGSVFHRPTWLQAVERGTGNSAVGLMLERGGGLEGWLPLTEIHSALFGRALVSSGFGVGGGVLSTRTEDAEKLCRNRFTRLAGYR